MRHVLRSIRRSTLRLLLCVSVVGTAFVVVPPEPAAAMYCGQRLVKNGDSRYRVRTLCGEPQDAIERVELRSVAYYGRASDGSRVRLERMVEVQIDEWTYDLGSQRLVRVFLFENGRLVSMSTRGYGVAP
ncbi:MAG: DUF2845 domain-containing protein [Polyangiales bacterium]